MRPHNTGVSKYSPTPKLVSAKVILKKVAIITTAASAASILVNKTQGRSPTPNPQSSRSGSAGEKNTTTSRQQGRGTNEMARRKFLLASVLSSFAESAIKTQYTQPSSSLATSTNNPEAWCSPHSA